ncbi:MAG: CcmD family protein [Gemmatimonadetes bacterium]|nr:MAG: CcmD family protein [Gemmatimonadota bacterium]
MTSMTALFLAYLAIWILLFIYMWRVSNKQHQLKLEIEELRESLEEK